jgi:DNA-binding CsgD family transcriptional regulator
LSDDAAPIRLALAVAETTLADRLAAVLADVPGLLLVRAGEAADAVIVAADTAIVNAVSAAPASDGAVSLTPRELDVLALLAQGASNKMIARELGISVHTAKFHVGSLIDKLDAVGRTDAVAHAARLGVIHL